MGIPAAAELLRKVNRFYFRRVRMEIHLQEWQFASDQGQSLRYKVRTVHHAMLQPFMAGRLFNNCVVCAVSHGGRHQRS